MLLQILLILGGLLLASELVRQTPAVGEELERVISGIAQYSNIIGLLLTVFGLIYFFANFFTIQGSVAVLVGLVLLIDKLDEVPGAGGLLKTIAEKVEPYDEWIGLAGVVIGLIQLF